MAMSTKEIRTYLVHFGVHVCGELLVSEYALPDIPIASYVAPVKLELRLAHSFDNTASSG
jgi:hypothetical protein